MDRRASFESARVGFIGAGRLGSTLAMAMRSIGVRELRVFSRSAVSARNLSVLANGASVMGRAQDLVDASDWIFITVHDDAIESVCQSLRWRAGVSVIHCSGVTPVAALQAAHDQGARIGGLHPLHTFGDPRVALQGLAGCAVAVEAEASLQSDLHELALAWGCRPFTLPAGGRALYHASAHYAGAFIVALLREATQLWARLGIPEEQALQALLPLLRATAASMQASGLAPGMAGVVARGDAGSLQQHLRALDAQAPHQAALYRTLSRLNIPLALQKGSLSPQGAEQLMALLNSNQEASS